MKIFIGDNLVDFNKKHCAFLGSGSESKVYLSKDQQNVIKIHKKDARMKEDLCLYLKELNECYQLEHFILPNELIYDRRFKFIGYQEKFIDGLNPFSEQVSSLCSFSKKEIINLLKKLKYDLNVLSYLKIYAFDFSLDNLILSDKESFLVDCGMFRRFEDFTRKKVREMNDILFEELVFEMFLRIHYDSSVYPLSPEFIKERDHFKYIEETMTDKQNVKEYVRTLNNLR